MIDDGELVARARVEVACQIPGIAVVDGRSLELAGAGRNAWVADGGESGSSLRNSGRKQLGARESDERQSEHTGRDHRERDAKHDIRAIERVPEQPPGKPASGHGNGADQDWGEDERDRSGGSPRKQEHCRANSGFDRERGCTSAGDHPRVRDRACEQHEDHVGQRRPENEWNRKGRETTADGAGNGHDPDADDGDPLAGGGCVHHRFIGGSVRRA